MIDVHAEAMDQAHRRLEESLRPVDERLHEWGKWTKNGAPHLGFPSQSSHLQPPTAETLTPPPTCMPPQIAEVDAAIARLSNIRQKVLAIAYMHYPALPTDFQRKKLRMSSYKWKAVLRESRLVIGAILGITA